MGSAPTKVHLAFQAKDEATVQQFYQAGLAAEGQDNGVPGEQHYHPEYYAAFLSVAESWYESGPPIPNLGEPNR